IAAWRGSWIMTRANVGSLLLYAVLYVGHDPRQDVRNAVGYGEGASSLDEVVAVSPRAVALQIHRRRDSGGRHVFDGPVYVAHSQTIPRDGQRHGRQLLQFKRAGLLRIVGDRSVARAQGAGREQQGAQEDGGDERPAGSGVRRRFIRGTH